MPSPAQHRPLNLLQPAQPQPQLGPPTRWNFSEGKNLLNPASHCDIAWAGALSTVAHLENKTCGVGAAVLQDDGSVLFSHQIPVPASYERDPEKAEADRVRLMLNSNDPAIWSRWR